MPDYEWVEFGKVFSLEKGKIASGKIDEKEDGMGRFITLNKGCIWPHIDEDICSIKGENVYMSAMINKSNSSFITISYYNGNAECSSLLLT